MFDCSPIGWLACASLFSVYLASFVGEHKLNGLRFMGRSLLHQPWEKCDDHDDSDKNGHADILTLRIGGRSSVDANIGSNGSHIFLIAVAMLVRTCTSLRRFRIPKEFCKFGVLFACIVASFLGFWSSSRLHFGCPEGSGAPFGEP